MRRKGPPQTVEDVLGPWQDPHFESGLIQRCRRYWSVPVTGLPNEALATYLRQRIAVALIAPEARRRVEAGFHDDSELYEDELGETKGDVALFGSSPHRTHHPRAAQIVSARIMSPMPRKPSAALLRLRRACSVGVKRTLTFSVHFVA